jgi:hypothetical protein
MEEFSAGVLGLPLEDLKTLRKDVCFLELIIILISLCSKTL